MTEPSGVATFVLVTPVDVAYPEVVDVPVQRKSVLRRLIPKQKPQAPDATDVGRIIQFMLKQLDGVEEVYFNTERPREVIVELSPGARKLPVIRLAEITIENWHMGVVQRQCEVNASLHV